MEILISGLGHIVVDDNVDTFKIDTTTEDICGDEDAAFVLLEFVVTFQSFLLGQTTINTH